MSRKSSQTKTGPDRAISPNTTLYRYEPRGHRSLVKILDQNPNGTFDLTICHYAMGDSFYSVGAYDQVSETYLKSKIAEWNARTIPQTFEYSGQKTFQAYNDPGHGWLMVRQDDLMALGIFEKISTFSYMAGEYAYLEEDCDAVLFVDTYQEKFGTLPTINDHYSNHSSRIRNYDPFMPTFLPADYERY